MYFRNLSRSSVSWSDVGKENSVPNQLLYTKQTSIRRTQGLDWTSAGVMFTTHTHTHTPGKAVYRNTQASHPELSERSRQKAKKRDREMRWSYRDS